MRIDLRRCLRAFIAIAFLLCSLVVKGSGEPAFAEAASLLQAATISQAEYWQLIQTTRDMAAQVQNEPVESQRRSFSQAASQWNNLAILALLDSNPPNSQALQDRLDALLQQRDSWPEQDFGSDELSDLQSILERPEFQWKNQAEAAPSPVVEWLNSLVDRFFEWLLGILEGRITTQSLGIGRALLVGLGALALLGLLLYFWRGLRRSFSSQAELEVGAAIEEMLSASEALKKAQQLSSSGDFRQGVRYLYLSALLQLEEQGLLRYDRSRTNREILREVSRAVSGAVPQQPEILHNLREVIEVFDRVWYGYQPLTAADFEHYTDQVMRLTEQR